ncbi:rhodanese-like domain-containing protein [Aquimarina sp. RZ0]|uniref:rhodanese-like domain-containing protein n=1 Tax=Aquimarina sp. RZ0 TaxID=2607730 RepID=UPI0011F2ABB8|nr:rhodanese-like domain-containing protein [Aquimarina sp. RZ0]KAA1247624.1 rhodanese-like domain-containing protein [Aquimarina sp. RZ0]
MKKQVEYYQNKLSYEMDPSDLFFALENQKDIIIMDTRQPFAYKKEHIPTAINLPHLEMTQENTEKLDKTKTYICYCDGIGCNASTKGALNMAMQGFTVKELIGGLAWWKIDGYATEGTNASTGSEIQCAC